MFRERTEGLGINLASRLTCVAWRVSRSKGFDLRF